MPQQNDKYGQLPVWQQNAVQDSWAVKQFQDLGSKYGLGDKPLQTAMNSAKQNNVPLWWLAHVINRESRFDPTAKNSTTSAGGLGQLTNATAQQYHVGDKYDPIQAIQGVGSYLGDLNKQFPNNFEAVNSAYLLGAKGYKDYLNGGSPTGAEQLPSVIKYLQDNNLTQQETPQQIMTDYSVAHGGVDNNLYTSGLMEDPFHQMQDPVLQSEENTQYLNNMFKNNKIKQGALSQQRNNIINGGVNEEN